MGNVCKILCLGYFTHNDKVCAWNKNKCITDLSLYYILFTRGMLTTNVRNIAQYLFETFLYVKL